MALRDRLLMLRSHPPRAAILAREAAKEPLGRKRVSDPELVRRLEPIMGLVADGTIPVDDQSAEAVGRAMKKMWDTAAKE